LSGSKLGAEGFEPADAVKGNVARAILYFIVRYYDRSIRNGMDYGDFWTKRVPMFLEWNKFDPPDAAERRRNELVREFQGNRNPFIDAPDLADRIGEKVFMSH
jgi:endonuclease I